MTFSFRCRNCGHLEHSGHAAEADLPHACRVCGAGVAWNPKGIKSFDPENWEVLADATPKRLAELGLTPADVESHEPWPKGEAQAPRNIQRSASEALAAPDKA